MYDVLAGLRRWLTPKQRRKLKRKGVFSRTAALTPTLQVRALEERRVFHAGAIMTPDAAVTQQTPPPPPAPTTTISLDAGHNLLVQDQMPGGQNDQLAIRYDAANSRYVISSSSQALFTEIAGSWGSGTNKVFIPVASVSGGKVIFNAGEGSDALCVDLSQGLGGKSLTFDGGAGNDAVTLVGGVYDTASYRFAADGTAQLRLVAGSEESLIVLHGVEPVQDKLAADVRRFTIGDGIAEARLSDDGDAANGLSRLETSLGTSVLFVSPQQRLSLIGSGGSSSQTLALVGLDAQFAADLRLGAGTSGQVTLEGQTFLRGGDLTVRGDTITVHGSITSNHATIDLAASNSLTVTATGTFDNRGGRILLEAGDSGTLAVSGRIDVSTTAAGKVGGIVHLLGHEVRLDDQATINASGHSGGGTVLVGGDYQGLNPLVRRAANTFVGDGASITASALQNGDGGKIIVWADEAAIVAGSGNLEARGGAQGGNGGFIETSGKRYLAIGGAADAGSPLGLAGTWLLDPFNVEIVAGSGGTIPAGGNFTAAANTTIGADTLEAALLTTNVTIFTGTGGNDADGNITVLSEISVALGNNKSSTLTLNAAHNIIVNANITATSGSLNVVLNANSTAGGQADPDTAVGSVIVSGVITTNGGSFTSTGIDFANSGAIAADDGTVTITHTGDVTLGANITTTAAATIATTGGDIAFDGAATLTAGSATLTASGAITADEAGTDINTSGGAITLNGTGGIGTGGRAITVAGAAGVVTATTGNAGVFLESMTDLNLGVIATGAGVHTVSITADNAAGLDISIGATSSTNDNWTLTATGNIVFGGAFRLTAGSATLDAGGTITSGTDTVDIDTSATGGAITLKGNLGIGANGSRIVVRADEGLVTLTTDDGAGHIYLRSTSSVNLGAVTTKTGTQTVNIVANSNAGDDIAIEASSNTDDNWTLLADDSIQFVGNVTVAAGSATLTATNGAITADTAATHIDTSALNGAITLASATGIGSSGQAITVAAAGGVVTATTGNADVYLASSSDLNLGVITTAAGTSTVSITANSVAGLGVNIGATSDTDDNWTVTTSGNIAFVGNVTVSAASASLSAGGAITSGTASVDLDTHDANGNITLSATGGMGGAANQVRLRADGGLVTLSTNSPGGDIYVVSTGQLNLGAVTTAAGLQTVNIQANAAIDIEASSTTDDNWTLAASGNIDFLGAVTLTAASANLTATGGSLQSGDAARDIVTSTSVSLVASVIGPGGEAVVLRPGTGTVSLDATNGGIDVEIETLGAGFATGKITLLESTSMGGAAVSLIVLDGQLTLDSVAGFQSLANDDVTLGTAGTDNAIHIANAVTFNVDSLTLAASGVITSAGNTAVLTTGATQEITLTADAIGTQALPVVVQPGSTMSVTASGDIYLRQAAGNLNTSIFTTLTSTGTGGVVSIGTLAGNVTINGTAGFSGLTDDTLVIQAAGVGADIIFDTTLTAGDATLIAEDAIVSDNTANADINTSAVDGDILLTAGGQIGDAANELRLTADDGLVTVNTTGAGGHVYLLSMGDLELGAVTTDAGSTQTMQIGTTTGNLTLTADNTLNDNMRLRAAGDLVVSDDVTTTALTFTDLRAGGSIVSGGTGVVDFRTTGLATDVLTITGGSVGTQSNPLHIDHEGKYTLTATGDLWLLIADGNLLTSDINSITMPTAGTTLGLITAGGSITVDSNALSGLGSKELHLEARGAGSNINLDAVAGTLTFAAVTLLAENGAITNLNAGLAIDTSAAGGDITLRTLGAIGANGSPVVVQAGGGQVSATTTGPGGDIYLRSQSQLHLGLIDAEDPGVQTIQLTSDLGIDIEVASVTEDDWELIALAGDIDFDGVGSLTANSVGLDASANINFNGSGGVTAASVSLDAGANINFNGSAGIVADTASLIAGGDITSGGSAANDIDTTGGAGVIHLEADGMGTSGNRVTLAPGTGNLEVIAGNDDVFLLVNSNGLAMSRFSVLSFAGAGNTFDLALANGDLTVDVPVSLAGTDVALRTLGATADIDFLGTGTITAADVTLAATGAITAVAGGVDITAGGNISLTGNLGIGAPLAPLVVVHGAAGVVTATTTTGNIYLASPGDLNLGVVTTIGGSQIVNVRSDLDLLISGASNTDDTWTLAALGNIQFSGAGQVTAAGVNATASGQILSGATGADVTVSGVANLVGATGIGAAGNGVSVVTGASGLVNASTSVAGAAVFLASPGLIRVGQIATAAGANTVQIMDQGGASEFEIVGASTTDDNWTLDSGGNVAFVNSGSVVARTFTADADGNITSGAAGVDINTAGFAGIIDLDAGGGVGSQFNPLSVTAWPAPVRAVGQTDDVYLTSPGHLLVDLASAGGVDPDVSLVTTGNQSQILAQVATLGNDQWHLVATGDINLEVAGSMQWSQVEDLRAIGAGRDVFVSTGAGPMNINTVHSGVGTADDNLTLFASTGNLAFSGTALLTATNANLIAFNGSILSTGNALRVDVTTGALSLVAVGAGGTIGAAGNAFSFSSPQLHSFAAAEQHLIAHDPTRVIQAETGNPGGSISLVQGTFFLDTLASLPANTPSFQTTMLHVEDGAHLGGSGLLEGTLHVMDGGVTNMGFGGEQAGLLRVQGDIVFDSGSELIVDINSPYTTAGRDYDHVQVNGNVFLNDSTLTLRGAQDLRTTINPIVLFELAPGMSTTGAFAVDDISLFQDGTDVRARVGQFRGKLSYFGGSGGNDIILNDLSLVPPVQQTGFILPPPEIPVFTRQEQLPVVVQPPPPLAAAIETPVVEIESDVVGIRYLEIRIVVPIDDAGNVEEVFAMKLPADWLTDLPAILRQLPDDRYRIYLILEGGNEERLVMDVLVRDGRPVEPNETQAYEDAMADPAAEAPAGERVPAVPTAAPAPAEPAILPALPELPALPPALLELEAHHQPQALRLFVGASAAVAAVVASRRKPDDRAKEADQVAETIGRGVQPTHSRWWRFSPSTSHHLIGQ